MLVPEPETRRDLTSFLEGDDNTMARTRKDSEAAVAALLDSVSTKSGSRRGRPFGSKNKPKQATETPKRRMARPKGSKNKPKATKVPAVRATVAVSTSPTKIIRRRRRRSKVVEQTLSQKVESMIAELTKLRAEVGQLERLRDALRAVNL